MNCVVHHSKNWVAHVRFGSIGACRRDVRFTPKSAHETDTGRVQRASPLLADLFPSSVIHPCPLYPQKRTLELSRGMSALCQKRTKCSAANSGYSITPSAPGD